MVWESGKWIGPPGSCSSLQSGVNSDLLGICWEHDKWKWLAWLRVMKVPTKEMSITRRGMSRDSTQTCDGSWLPLRSISHPNDGNEFCLGVEQTRAIADHQLFCWKISSSAAAIWIGAIFVEQAQPQIDGNTHASLDQNLPVYIWFALHHPSNDNELGNHQKQQGDQRRPT